MKTNNQSPVIYPEIISEMTGYEKKRLMDELTVLMQSQSARVEVAQERGFPYLWHVLTGKQRRLQRQITVDQTQINEIVQTMLQELVKNQVHNGNDIAALNERMYYQERITALQSMYIIRMNQEIARLGGQAPDTAPLDEHLADAMRKVNHLPEPVYKNACDGAPIFYNNDDHAIPDNVSAPNNADKERPERVLSAAVGFSPMGALAAGLCIALNLNPYDLNRWMIKRLCMRR